MKTLQPKPAELLPLETHTLREQISDRLRDAILDGSLRAGDRIVERQLAAQMGASLTAVREALIELETEGFIRKRRNATTHITLLSAEEVEDALRAREVLEGWAVQEAARNITAEGDKALKAAYRALQEAARSQDRKAFIHCDLDLHRTLWRLAGSPTMVAAIERALLPFFAFAAIRIVSEPFANVDLKADATAHKPLIDAVAAGDLKLARAAFSQAMQLWKKDAKEHIVASQELKP
jgi:DNA-binding GntR family transcriptional regulator